MIYFRFMQNHTNLSWMDELRLKNPYPCPGFVGDPDKPRFIDKFDVWYERPRASWRLYWRLHPEAYEAVREYYKGV